MNEVKSKPILFSAPMVRAILAGEKTQTRRVVKPAFGVKHPILNLAEHGETNGKYSGKHNDPASWGYPFAEDGADIPLMGYGWENLLCPYGQVGDQLWVRETHSIVRYSLDYETGNEASFEKWDSDLYGPPEDALKRDPRGGHCALVCYAADGEDKNPTELYSHTGINGKVLVKQEIDWKPSIFMPRWASRITLGITGIRVERLQDISHDDAIAEGIKRAQVGKLVTFEVPDTDIEKLHPVVAYEQLWESINGKGSWDVNPWVWVIEFKRIIE